jgi:hypothetical protein
MKIVMPHRQRVELFDALIAISEAGLDDRLTHEYRRIREQFPARDGDQNSHPNAYRLACKLASKLPSELCDKDDLNADLIAAFDAAGAYPRQRAMIEVIMTMGDRARALLYNRQLHRAEVRA